MAKSENLSFLLFDQLLVQGPFELRADPMEFINHVLQTGLFSKISPFQSCLFRIWRYKPIEYHWNGPG